MAILLRMSQQIGEKLILRKRLKIKVWESVRSIDWYFGNSEVHFYMKTVFLHQILQVTERLSIEDTKIFETSKSTLGYCLRYFDFASP